MQPKRKKQKLDESVYSSYTDIEFIKNQLDELFAGIKQSPDLDFQQISQYLLSLKSTKKQTIGEAVAAQKSKKNSVWPLSDSFIIPNGSYKFVAPEQVRLSGGAESGTMLKSALERDLLVIVPDSFYQPKDYLNCRYFVKRTLYLAHLAAKLQKCEFVKNTKLRYLSGDVLKPVLCMKLKSGPSFNIILAISKNVFKASLLQPDKNALRPDKLFTEPGNCLESSTPFYNSSILSDIINDEFQGFLGVVSQSPGLQQALTTLKFWCRRKKIAVSGHIMTAILHHLYKSSSISPDMDVLTILKQVWSFIAVKFVDQVSQQGLILGETSTEYPGLFTETDANVLYNTDTAALVELARHSRIMIDMLDSSRDSSLFVSVLTEPVTSLFDLYDIVFEAEVPPCASSLQHTLQYAGVAHRGIADHTHEVLSKAYGDRAHHVRVCCGNPTETWPRKSQPPTVTHLTVGVMVNQENWMRQVERGPSAETPASLEFKEFWGEKSNLRRFQDGSIIQAVVWEGKTVQERRSILAQITKHVLARHVGVTQVRELKFDSGTIVGRAGQVGDGEEQAQKIIKTFNELSKILRKCSKIPLSVTSVQGVAPVLRNTELYPQLEYQVKRSRSTNAVPNSGSACPPYIAAHEMVCHFETSGKWPEDVRGILRLKAAFYLALKEELESIHIPARVNPDFLDIARNGFIFRLRFFVPKETKLRSTNISFWTPSSSDDLKIQTEIMPHVSSLLGSFSLQHSAFPLTVRYLKSWISSHNLSNCIPDIFCELVAAHCFLTTWSYGVPRTATAGFLRVLSFLANFNWDLYPVLVNLNEELPSETFERFSTFINTRRAYPDACIVCPHDEQSLLTRDAPTKTSLRLLQMVAERALQSNTVSDEAFKPDTSSFNVVIHLKPSQTGFAEAEEVMQEHHAKSSQFPVVDYNPVEYYVKELTQAYDHLCVFFYNKWRPRFVGVMLKRPENTPVKFTVNGSMARVPCGKKEEDDVAVRDNLDAMLSDFALLGKGLVKNVEVLKLDL